MRLIPSLAWEGSTMRLMYLTLGEGRDVCAEASNPWEKEVCMRRSL